MKKVILNEKDVIDYVVECLNVLKNGYCFMSDNLYHHNSSYDNAKSICENGILTVESLYSRKIGKYSDKSIDSLKKDDFHVNGIDSVSLSLIGLDDLYPDEFEYDPLNSYLVDFLISEDLNTNRSTINYGNEFLFYGDISIDKIHSLDIRLLKYIKQRSQKIGLSNSLVNDIIDKYNNLIDISLIIKKMNLNVSLREMSFEDNSLIDLDKLSSSKKIVLSK